MIAMRNSLVLAVALMAACGDDGSDVDERVSCDASWDAEYGNLDIWDGTCEPGCEAMPAVGMECQIEGVVNDEPALVDCNEFGAGVDVGGEVVCCVLYPNTPGDSETAWHVAKLPCV